MTPKVENAKRYSLIVSFPFSFQFFTRLTAVFLEEVGDFIISLHCNINNCFSFMLTV